MRPAVRLYATLIIVAAAVLGLADVAAVATWRHDWAPLCALALLALYLFAVHFQFQIQSTLTQWRRSQWRTLSHTLNP